MSSLLYFFICGGGGGFCKELFIDIFGEEFGTLYMGGSIPDFHTADCYYGTWVRES